MSRAADLPPGITMTRSGDFAVRLRVAPGSNERASRVFVDEICARLAHVLALEAQRNGGDVQAALDSVPDNKPLPRPTQPETAPRLSAELDRYLEVREKRSAASNHKRRHSPKKGVIGMRPGSLRALRDKLAILHAHLGKYRVNELSNDVVEAMVTALASASATSRGGYAVSTVNGILVTLRSVVGRTAEKHRHGDFPWKDVAAIASSGPRRPAPDPSKWGGAPGSRPPFLPLPRLVELANMMWAADRIVLYTEYLGGPRIGEIFGLQYKHLKFDGGRLWVTIEQQVDDHGVLREWAKTDAGYRTIPLAGILAEYLEMYCRRYGDYDLRNPDPARRDEFVVRNSAGRDADGSFLPGRRSPFSSRFTTTRDRVGFGHDVLGYEFTPHTGRKSCATILLRATSIVYDISQHRKALRKRYTVPPIAFQPIDVSAYLGQEHDGQGDQLPANPVTLDYYNLSMLESVALTSIADVIDYIARDRVVSLLDEPDENDQLDVHPIDDPEWMTSAEAASVLGLYRSNVIAAIHTGRLDGHKGWLADGGWKRNATSDRTLPALPQYFVSRASVDLYRHRQQLISLNEAGNRLGMTADGFKNTFVAARHIELHPDGIEPADLERLITEIHMRLIILIDRYGPVTPRSAQRLFRSDNVDFVGDNPRWQLRWYERWLHQLAGAGRLSRRADGSYAIRRPRPATGELAA